jgi:isoleucyl-tRNA synthetase
MAAAREMVAVGRGARAEARIKVRQPLEEAVIACPPAVAEEVAGLVDLIADELNVRRVRFVTDPGELVDVTLKPNYRRLGPRFGPRMPRIAAAVAELPATATARAIDAGEEVRIALDGEALTLEPEDLLREARPTAGYAVGQEASLAVGLATEITPDLRREALAREVVHAVQNARRAAGLRVEERIVLHLDGSAVLREAVDAHREAIAAETLAPRLTVGHGAPFAGLRHEEHEIEGEPLALRLDRAG